MKYVIDIDGILCEKKGPYKDRIPIKNNIKKVNRIFNRGGLIILYTSRYNLDRQITEEWLDKNKVKFNILLMGKIKYDVWIDDKSKKW